MMMMLLMIIFKGVRTLNTARRQKNANFKIINLM